MLIFYIIPLIIFLIICYFDAEKKYEIERKNFFKLFLKSLTNIKNYLYFLYGSLFVLLVYLTTMLDDDFYKIISYPFIILIMLIPYFITKIYKNQIKEFFAPKEIKVILEKLKKIKKGLDNKAFEIIEEPIKKYIFNNKMNIAYHLKKGDNLDTFLINIINSTAGDYFESGKHPYKGNFGIEYGNGYYLLKIFDDTINKKVKLNIITREKGEKQKKIIRTNNSHLIERELPFI